MYLIQLRAAVLSLAAAVVVTDLGFADDLKLDRKEATPSWRMGSPIPEDQFDRLHKLICPQPGESKWARIPWMWNLMEARKRAVEEDKPLLFWRAGGGDPLGRV
jgi:hypothetical protein